MIDSVLLIRPFAAEKKEFPLGCLYVGTALKEKGYRVQIIDLQDQPEREQEIVDILLSSPTTALGISALAPHYKWVKTFSLRVKRESPSTPIIVGGHIAICRQLLLEKTGADYVCLGEGEETLPDLIATLNEGKPIEQVAGIAFRRQDGTTVKTAWRQQLKEFSIPDYSLIDIERYLIHPSTDPFFNQSAAYKQRETPNDRASVIMFSRGCIGHCGFCYRHHAGYRQMSIEKSLEHVMLLYEKYGIKYLRIDDELFTNNPEWMRQFCQKIIESKLGILFRITGLRVDTIDDERLTLLKDAGCVGINYGIESCSQAILNTMLKMVTVEQNLAAIRKTLAHGLATMAYVIWGYQGETKITAGESIDALVSLGLPSHLVSLFYLVALPGTTVYANALRERVITDEDAYLDSIYVLMEKREGIHKIYLHNYSAMTVPELRQREEILFFLLTLRRFISYRPGLFKIIRQLFERIPAPIFLTGLKLVYRFSRILKNIPTIVARGKNKATVVMEKLRLRPFQSALERAFDQGAAQTYQESLRLTMNWLINAQQATMPGFSRGFSLLRDPKFNHQKGWQPPYPETTGYCIPTILRAKDFIPSLDAVGLAARAGIWEMEIALANGAIPGGHLDKHHRNPALFDTGQVIRGWIALFIKTNNQNFLTAAIKSAQWMLDCEYKQSGTWQTNHADCVDPKTTTYLAYAAAPIVELGLLTSRAEFVALGKRVADHTLKQQNGHGWFRGADFKEGKAALLHTVAYTIDGLWDIGSLVHEQRYLDAAHRAADGVLSQMSPDGFVPGRLFEDWKSATRWACLTGTSQMGIIFLKLYSTTRDSRYLKAAERAASYVHRCQNHIDPTHGGLGGVWGSWPIDGEYQPYQAINWAAKFYADLLMDLITVQKQP